MGIVRGLLRLFRPRRRVRVVQAGAARVLWNAAGPIELRAYTAYCVALLRDVLGSDGAAVDLVLGDADVARVEGRRTVRVGLQVEHTLVKPGGRDSARAEPGAVPLPDGGGTYLVRVADFDTLNACDLVIEYSRANIENLRRSTRFDAFQRRVVCIAPILYPPASLQAASQTSANSPAPRPRSRPAITLFADTTQPRRARFLADARAANLPLRNVRRTFDADALAALYRDTRVLVNVHQTDHHHTLEELRVLPALLCGVLVVSEDVPLRETVPYARFIVWAKYGELVATVREVLANEAEYRRAIFDGDGLHTCVAQMRADDVAALHRALRGIGCIP